MSKCEMVSMQNRNTESERRFFLFGCMNATPMQGQFTGDVITENQERKRIRMKSMKYSYDKYRT